MTDWGPIVEPTSFGEESLRDAYVYKKNRASYAYIYRSIVQTTDYLDIHANI